MPGWLRHGLACGLFVGGLSAMFDVPAGWFWARPLAILAVVLGLRWYIILIIREQWETPWKSESSKTG